MSPPFRFALGQRVQWAEEPNVVWQIVLRRYVETLHMPSCIEYGLRSVIFAGITPSIPHYYADEAALAVVETMP